MLTNNSEYSDTGFNYSSGGRPWRNNCTTCTYVSKHLVFRPYKVYRSCRPGWYCWELLLEIFEIPAGNDKTILYYFPQVLWKKETKLWNVGKLVTERSRINTAELRIYPGIRVKYLDFFNGSFKRNNYLYTYYMFM